MRHSDSAENILKSLISQEVLDEIQRSFVEKHGVGLCIYSKTNEPLTHMPFNLPGLEQLNDEQKQFFRVFYRMENLDTGLSHADTKPIYRSFSHGLISRCIFPVVYKKQTMAFATLLHIPKPLSSSSHQTLLVNLKRVNEDVERLDFLLDKTSSFQSDLAVLVEEVRNILNLFIEAGWARAGVIEDQEESDKQSESATKTASPTPRVWSALIFCSPNGTVIDAHSDAAELLGYDTPNDLCDLNLLSDLLLYEKDRQKLRSLVLSETDDKIELALLRNDKKTIPLQLQLCPQRDDDAIVGFECRLSTIDAKERLSEIDKDQSAIGIITDHMQKKQEDISVSDSLMNWGKEESQEEIPERLRSDLELNSGQKDSTPFLFSFKSISQLLDSVPFPLFVVDANDNVRLWNHSMETVLGIKLEAALERNFLSFIVSNSHPTWERWKQQLFAGEVQQIFAPKIRLPLLKRDQTVLLAPVKLQKVHMYDQDFISVMLTLEEPLEEAKTAVHSVREQNHPIDTLSVLQFQYKKIRKQFANAADTLSDSVSNLYIESLQNESSKQKYDSVRRISDICAYINRQITYFTQESIPSLQQVDMNYVVNKISLRLQHFLPSIIELRTNFEKALKPVLADQDMLVHALGTIAKNAIDAMPGGGTLTIETESKQDQVLVRVSDNGLGITKEAIPHVFEPFFTTKEQTMGKGLGLSAAYGIIKAHKGKITISSDQQGTTFSVFLPVQKAISASKEFSAKGKILVIDDAVEIAEATSFTLKREGYETVIGTSLEQGVQLFERYRNSLDAVIIDNRLGDHSGLYCAKHILRISPHIPIVFYSGADDDLELAAFIRKRGAGWLLKPFTSKELTTELEKVIRAKKRS